MCDLICYAVSCCVWSCDTGEFNIQGGPKTDILCFVRLFLCLDFVKYWPIFKLISLSESGEHL